MKKIAYLLASIVLLSSCSQNNNKANFSANKELAVLFNNYHNDLMRLEPLHATFEGDNRYNDLFPVDFTDSYRQKIGNLYSLYLKEIEKFDRDSLDENDKISYDIFKYDMTMNLEGLAFHDNYRPFDQFTGRPLLMGILGSGGGLQPFKTVRDYDNWIKRATAFSAWADSAIVYFRKGIASGWVLPKALVVKMIPQMYAMVSDSVKKSLFYGPINKMPESFSDSDKQRLTAAYQQLIAQQIIPSYKKLGDFLKNEYLPKARTTSGLSAVPGGIEYYKYKVRLMTSTNETPEEIYNTGLEKVKRIHHLMDSVKNAVGFKGDMNAFFKYLRTDKKFMPYKTPEDVLNAFRAIQQTIEPHLKDFISLKPTSKFVIRQTEAFRAASSSVQYFSGTPDGSRPGVLYIPIVDATKFNDLMNQDLFLHEAIPGHHVQVSLQHENKDIPNFRRFASEDFNGAYIEGWALYCESMGKQLGCYTDPYQYMGYLEDDMHRAIRLVVDVGMHIKGMTRDEAIQYSMDNEPASEAGTIAEIERYIAFPAQALCYKVGALKIISLKNKYKNELGNKFNLIQFHDELLKDGSMPLGILENKMDRWANKLKSKK